MIRLQDLAPGQKITGLHPDGAVQVIQVERYGDHTANLLYRDPAGTPREQVVSREMEAQLALAQGEATWPFDADAEHFKLGVEAQRIQLAHLFDPMMAVHTSNVDPLPHQISAVYEHMLHRQPLRYVLADDPGAGKTIMAGLLIRELDLRADAERVLIVAPGSLVEQWQDELHHKFGLHFEIFSNEMQEAAASRNAFQEQDRLIARLDQLARNDDYRNLLDQTRWDLIVVDEAHKMSASYTGSKLHETKRFKLGKQLGRLTRNLLLMTATPHNGKDTDFQLFLSLLDQDRFYGKFRDGVHKADATDVMRRMVKEDLRKFDGTPLFPERRAYTVNYELSDAEAALYDQVTEYVRNEMNRADQLSGQKKNTVGFALTLLQRRLASSPEAIYQSLKRRRKRLQNRTEEERRRQRGDHIAETLAEYRIRDRWLEDADEAEEALTAEEYEEFADQIVDQASASRTIEELESEINTLESLEKQAHRVVQSGQDRKWEELRNLLQENELMFSEGRARRKLIIFTEHKDTLNYLVEQIGNKLLGQPNAVKAIHGGVSRDERRKIQDDFYNDPGLLVLVATDAAGEGVNLQCANLMINYDLPWNPNRLEQRFGRIHRIGQEETCHLWNLVATQTREGEVFLKLFQKLETEREALGGRVFDILGEAFEGVSLRDLIIQAIRSDDNTESLEQAAISIERAMSHDNLMHLIKRDALFEQTLTMEQLFTVREQMEKAEARKLQPRFIRSFFKRAFEELGGELRKREGDRWEIPHVPARIREHDKRRAGGAHVSRRYARICFEKSAITVRGQPPASLIHPGQPLMRSLMELILRDYKGALDAGAVLVDESDPSTEPRLLFMLEHQVRESAGDPPRVVSQRLQFVYAWPDGRFSNAGWAPHLALNALPSAHQSLVESALETGELAQVDEQAVLGYAIQHLAPEHFKEVQDRRRQHVEKTERAVRDRLMREIEYHQRRYRQLREAVADGKQPRVQPENARREVEQLTARLEARQQELNAQREVASAPPRILSAALVIPQGMIEQAEGRADQVVSAEARKRVEMIAMDAVRRVEEGLGHVVRDVSADNCGWDLTAHPPIREGEELPAVRHIEVKGRAAGEDAVSVTSNEVREGLNQGGKYYLAVVLVDGEQIDGPHYIRRPFESEPDWAESSRRLQIRDLLRRADSPGKLG